MTWTKARKNAHDALLTGQDKLADYIDALLRGAAREGALVTQFSERLVLATLFRHPGRIGELVSRLEAENGAFSRDLLATDEGREARSAFNSLRRTALEISELRDAVGRLPLGPETVVGETLTSVLFYGDGLHDEEVQLGFTAGSFSSAAPITLFDGTSQFVSGDSGFRDALCNLLGTVASSFEEMANDVRIGFEGRVVMLSLNSPEAEPLVFHDASGRATVFEAASPSR